MNQVTLDRVENDALLMLLQSGGITVHPWPGQKRPTYQLEIEVLSVEGGHHRDGATSRRNH